MADSTINLPPGYALEGQTQPSQPSQPPQPPQPAPSAGINLPPGYSLEQAPQTLQTSSTPQPEGILDTWKKELVGPNTMLGAAIGDVKDVGAGISQMASGDVSGGAKRALFGGAEPHVQPGSMLEKAIQTVNPNFKGAGTPEQAAASEQGDIFSKPMVDVAQTIDKNQHPILKALTEQAQGMTSPTNVGIMIATGGLGLVDSPQALATANKLLSAGFSAHSIGSAYKNLRGFAAAYEKGDANEALYQLASAVASGTMSVIAGAHAAGAELPVASETDKAVAGKVAGKVSDVAGAITDAGSNTKQALIKAAGFGQDFDQLIQKISPPSKGATPGYGEKVIAASPFLRDILNKNPNISTPKEFSDAIFERQQKVDAELLDRASDVKGAAQGQMPGIVDRTMAHLDDYFESQGAKYKPEEIEKAKQEVRDFMEQEGALKDPDLFNVEKIRQRFNEDSRSTFTQDPGTVPAAVKIAKAEAGKFLRPEIDAKYDKIGVSGVKEWRKLESSLIDVRDQLELAQKKSEEMGDFSILKSSIKNVGWPTVIAATTGGPIGLTAERAARIGADYVTDYKTNPNTLISRAKAGAGSGGQPGTPEFGQVPPAPLALPPAPIQTPIRFEPIEPTTGQPAVDPETRAIRLGLLLPEAKEPINISGVRTEPIEPLNPPEVTRPGVQPKASNRQLPAAGQTSGPATVEPATTGVRLHTPSLNMPESTLTLPKDMPAELKPVADEAKEAAKQSGVEFRGIQEGAGDHPGVAIFEHPKYGSVGVKLDNFSPEQLQRQVSELEQRNAPKSEELDIPKSRSANVSPESLRAHELGHAVVGHALGLQPESIMSHLHPSLANGRTAMSARFDLSSIGARPNGDIPTSVLADHLGDLLTTHLAGGVAQQLIDGTPIEKNPHMYGDLMEADRLLRDLQVPEDRIKQHMMAATERARSILNQGDTIKKMREAAAVRDPGTHEHFQISADRLQQILNDISLGEKNEGDNQAGDQERTQHNPGNDAGGEGESKSGTREELTVANITEDELADRIREKTNDSASSEERAKHLIAARDGKSFYSEAEKKAAPMIIQHYLK